MLEETPRTSEHWSTAGEGRGEETKAGNIGRGRAGRTLHLHDEELTFYFENVRDQERY